MVNIPHTISVTKSRVEVSAKLYGLVAMSALFGGLAGYLFSGGMLAWGAIILVVFLTLLILQTLFIDKQKLLSLGVTLGAVAFAIPFFRLISVYFLAALLVFIVFLIHGAYRGRHEIDNMIKVRFSRVVHVITTSMITAVVIFLSATLILSSNFSVKKERVDQMVKIATPIIGRFINNFTPEMQARELFVDIVMKDAVKDKRFQVLSQAQKQSVINQGVLELEGRFEDSIGAEVSLDASVSENVHKIIETKLGSLTPRAQLYWSIIAIAAIWASVRSVEFLIYIPLALLAFLMYELLFALGFVSLQMETRSKEVISLK